MEISAVIFDLDGTVIGDEDEYGLAFGEILKDLGVEVASLYPHVGGIGVKENWRIFLKKFKIKTKKSLDELALETQRAYLKRLWDVDTKAGFSNFIYRLRQSNILTALATSNEWWVVEEIIDKLRLESYFDTITTSEEVILNKPSPDIFQITADKLGAESGCCIVIEDSKAGIDAAHNAGMKAIGLVRDSEHAQKLKGADLLIENYFDLSIDQLKVL